MIAANKRFLKANLTQGVLGIQTNLVNLYQSNLSAIATQAALIAGFSFTAVSTTFARADVAQLTLSYFYYVCFTICLVAALFALSQATIVVMFGPTMALKGSTDEAVKVAAGHMMEQQVLIFKISAISVTSLFMGAMLLSWSTYPIGIAAITTIVYLGGYYLVIKEGFKAYYTFVPNDDGVFVEPVGGQSMDLNRGDYRHLKGGGEGGIAAAGESKNNAAEIMHAAQEAIKLKTKGPLWKRQSIEDGGLFIKYYAVLDKGRLDFYAKEKDYRDNNNPVNSKPIKLWQYEVELDPRKYARNVTSISSTMKSAMLGNEDFSMADLLTSEHDLQLASRNYKFGLVPKVSSELVASTNHELLAHDEKSFRQWKQALQTVVRAYDEIAAMPSVEQTIRIGSADVEMVVQAANNV